MLWIMRSKTIKTLVMSMAVIIAALTPVEGAFSANPKRTVTRVTASVTIQTDIDYHISSDTPFSDAGSINILNTDHAVLIFDALRPSQALSWLNHVTIDGTAAVNDNNCQVRVYGKGTIIYPYARNLRPLTLYEEPGLEGTSANTFSTGNNNGFMNNLSSSQLNNRFKSFRLKRGYMVTFATGKGGYGYSRCFIADDEDLEVTLPTWLQGRFSSYRLFKWNDVSKCGWGGTQVECMSALNATWCYDWGAPDPRNIDWECVPQHHHEGWPSIDEVGRNGTSCHALGNNEPDNTADASEQYQTVAQVLANWPQMMATGKRLGTPAMAGSRAWLKEFCDSIDARGWRCDFCAIHIYSDGNQWDWDWLVNEYFNQSNQRPIWITEMNSGAEWTGWWGGDDRSANPANYQIQKDHFAPVLNMLMGHDKVERIAPFNSFWIDKCRMFYNWDDADPVTPIGHHYADLQAGLAYSGRYDKVPSAPRIYGPQNAALTFVSSSMINRITWKDVNGEFNADMWVERRTGGEWQRVMTAKQAENEATYTYRDTVSIPNDYAYRVAIKSAVNNRTYYSPILSNATATSKSMTSDENVQWGVVELSQTKTNGFCYFSRSFAEQPAIVFGGPTNTNELVAPCEQVNNFSRDDAGGYSSFRFSFLPWTLQSQQTFTAGTESSTFIAAGAGTGSLGTLHYEAGYVGESDNEVASGTILSYTFTEPFASVPVVLASPYYSGTDYPLMCRVFDVTEEGFKVVLQRQKGLSSQSGAAEVKVAVGFFAVEQGETIDALGRQILVKSGVKRLAKSNATASFLLGTTLLKPHILVQMQSMNREDVIAITRQVKQSGEQWQSAKFMLMYDPTAGVEVSSSKPVSESFGMIAIGETEDAVDAVTLMPETAVQSPQIYDLQGRKLQRVPQRGIYIVNGKKVLR